jgi:hypothetical protein
MEQHQGPVEYGDNSDATYAQDLSPGDPLKGIAGKELPRNIVEGGALFNSFARAGEWVLEGQITRCGCTDEQKAAPDWHAKLNLVCPRPREVERKKELAYYHPSMLRRTTRRLLRLFNHPKGAL